MKTGTLVINNPTGPVTITIAALRKYSIATSLTGCTADASNPSTIVATKSATLKFTANTGYVLPDSIAVSGATAAWNSTTGTLNLSNPTGNVSITVTCIRQYAVTGVLTHAKINGSSSYTGTILAGGQLSVSVTADTGYIINTLGVTGATYHYDTETGTLALSNPVDDVEITVVAISRLTAPTIALNGTTVNITNTDDRTEYDTVYDDGTLVGTVYLNTQEGSVVTVVSGLATQSGSEVTIQ